MFDHYLRTKSVKKNTYSSYNKSLKQIQIEKIIRSGRCTFSKHGKVFLFVKILRSLSRSTRGNGVL